MNTFNEKSGKGANGIGIVEVTGVPIERRDLNSGGKFKEFFPVKDDEMSNFVSNYLEERMVNSSIDLADLYSREIAEFEHPIVFGSLELEKFIDEPDLNRYVTAYFDVPLQVEDVREDYKPKKYIETILPDKFHVEFFRGKDDKFHEGPVGTVPIPCFSTTTWLKSDEFNVTIDGNVSYLHNLGKIQVIDTHYLLLNGRLESLGLDRDDIDIAYVNRNQISEIFTRDKIATSINFGKEGEPEVQISGDFIDIYVLEFKATDAPFFESMFYPVINPYIVDKLSAHVVLKTIPLDVVDQNFWDLSILTGNEEILKFLGLSC